MRRIILTFAASAALALSLGGLAVAEPATPALAVTTGNLTTDSVFPASVIDHGQGYLSTLSESDSSTYFVIRDGSSKWYEIEDTAGTGGECLTLTGSVSAGFYVDEEFCNFRSAELWTFPSGLGNGLGHYQIQNQYGTTLYGHDACMWSDGDGTDVAVKECVSSQPAAQLWLYSFE